MPRLNPIIRRSLIAAVLICAACLAPPLAAQDRLPQRTAGTTASPGAATSAQMSAVMADVQQIGAQDPAAQQVLLDDMKKTDPSLWPQLVQVFRSSLAYRQQSADRLAQGNPNYPTTNAPAATSLAGAGSSQPARQASFDAPNYPTTGYPAAAIARPPSQPAQTATQSLPDSSDGPVFSRSTSTDVATRYPDTLLPSVKLVNTSSTTANSQQSSADWRDQLAATIRALENQTAATAVRQPNPADLARLRLLYLIAGRRDEATTPLPGDNAAQQEFWNRELAGLATLIDDKSTTDPEHRASQAATHLRAATAELEQNSPLVLRHLAFCTEVSSFGVYKPFPNYQFKHGQEALLYAEVENFTSTDTQQGFHTVLHSSYQILDNRGDRIAHQDFAVTEENCRNRRRDFFVRYFLNVPKTLPAGDYTLQLTVEDTQGNKAGQANIPFSIVGD